MPRDGRDGGFSWRQIYLSAAQGDVQGVRPLNQQKLHQQLGLKAVSNLKYGILEKAAAEGQKKIVFEILHGFESSSTPQEIITTILTVLPSAVNAARTATVKSMMELLLNELMALPKEPKNNQVVQSVFRDYQERVEQVILKMLETTRLDVFKVIEESLKFRQIWYKNALRYAFKNGNNGVFEYILRKSKLTLSQAEKQLGIPEFFLAIAVGQGFEEDYYRKLEFWKRQYSWSYFSSHPPLSSRPDIPNTAFAVAARFGKLRMLKHLEREKSLIGDDIWCMICRDMYREAVRFGHRKVVNYINHKRKNSEYCDHLHADYLQEQFDFVPGDMYKIILINYIELVKKNIKNTKKSEPKISSDLLVEILRKIKKKDQSSAIVIVENFMDYIGQNGMNNVMLEAVRHELVDLVMYMLDKVNLKCPFSQLGHNCLNACFRRLWDAPHSLPNPIIADILLETIPISGSSCLCGDALPMDYYISFKYCITPQRKIVEDFERNLHDMAVMLEILASRGLVPRMLSVKLAFRQYFRKTDPPHFIGARLLCLSDWIDLIDVYDVEILGTGRWFHGQSRGVNKFIFRFLRSLCGSKRDALRWNGFLAYVASRKEAEREKIMRFVQEIGLKIVDRAHYYVPTELKNSEEYHFVRVNLNKNVVNSLQSLARLRIFKCARARSSAAFQRGKFLPLSRVVFDICREFFPHLKYLMEFGEFMYF